MDLLSYFKRTEQVLDFETWLKKCISGGKTKIQSHKQKMH